MAITTRDGLIAALAAGPDLGVYRASVNAQSTGRLFSLWRATGSPAQPGLPGANAACDRTTAGAVPLGAPGGANTWYLSSVELGATQSGVLLVADRLVHSGIMSGIVTTAQAQTAVTLPTRGGTGVGVQAWLEVYGALGATVAATVTASYTNQAGTAGQTATLVGGIPANAQAGSMFPLSLQAGDTGVRSVESVTVTTSTGTAGAFGITLLKLLSGGNVFTANTGFAQGYADLSLPLLGTDPCIFLVGLSTGTTGTTVVGSLAFAQG